MSAGERDTPDPSELPEPLVGSVEFRRPVRYLLDPEPDGETAGRPPRPLLVALHGQGMTAGSFRRVLRHRPPTGHRLLVPEGPYVFERREADGIRPGHGWYIYLGDQEAFRVEMERAEAHLLAVLDRVEAEHGPVDRARSVVLGFSQGGYLAGFVGLRNPARFGGVVVCAARVKHEFLVDELAGGSLPPVLHLHSPDDPLTPIDLARASRDRLAAAGVDVELREHAGGHRLPPEGLAALGDWLAAKGLIP